MNPAAPLEALDLPALRTALLRWYRREQRPLPWRVHPSLYGTWISEIMLQQTTVGTVVPFWERFLARFPDLQALASAEQEDVLALWSGLGYYRRARSLHTAARQLVAENRGRLPGSRDEWLALPGIGAYTAGAIASIGLGEAVPAVDGNARRVLSRWLCSSGGEVEALRPAALTAAAAGLVPGRDPGRWNQAVMELGARVCLPSNPSCATCPVARHCRAGLAGATTEVPALRPRPLTVRALGSVLVCRRREGVLLLPAGTPPQIAARGWGRPVRRSFATLFAGLWGLPGSAWYPDPRGGDAGRTRTAVAPVDLSAWQEWLGEVGLRPRGQIRQRGEIAHGITVYRLRLRVVAAEVSGRGVGLPAGARWNRFYRGSCLPVTALSSKACRVVLGP